MKCEHLKLVRGADGVLRCMDCGEELDRPDGMETKPEPEKKPARRTTTKKGTRK